MPATRSVVVSLAQPFKAGATKRRKERIRICDSLLRLLCLSVTDSSLTKILS